MAWGYTYRASWAPLALFSQVWLVSDCEIVCGKRFGNQWFWQVGALLVALQVYNHSFRSSVPRLGNRSFSLCFIHSLAFSSGPRFEIGLVAWKTNWNLGGQRILGSRQKQKCIRLLYCCLNDPSSSHLQFRSRWQFSEYYILSIRVVILFYSARGMRELTSRLSIFLQEATLYNLSTQRSSVTK